jgi:hypothetical protein
MTEPEILMLYTDQNIYYTGNPDYSLFAGSCHGHFYLEQIKLYPDKNTFFISRDVDTGSYDGLLGGLVVCVRTGTFVSATLYIDQAKFTIYLSSDERSIIDKAVHRAGNTDYIRLKYLFFSDPKYYLYLAKKQSPSLGLDMRLEVETTEKDEGMSLYCSVVKLDSDESRGLQVRYSSDYSRLYYPLHVSYDTIKLQPRIALNLLNFPLEEIRWYYHDAAGMLIDVDMNVRFQTGDYVINISAEQCKYVNHLLHYGEIEEDGGVYLHRFGVGKGPHPPSGELIHIDTLYMLHDMPADESEIYVTVQGRGYNNELLGLKYYRESGKLRCIDYYTMTRKS